MLLQRLYDAFQPSESIIENKSIQSHLTKLTPNIDVSPTLHNRWPEHYRYAIFQPKKRYASNIKIWTLLNLKLVGSKHHHQKNYRSIQVDSPLTLTLTNRKWELHEPHWSLIYALSFLSKKSKCLYSIILTNHREWLSFSYKW